MFIQAFPVLLSFVLQATAAAYQRQSLLETSDKCPEGVYIIGIRGTLEEPGFGAMQPVFEKLLHKLPGSDGTAIEYPASGITIGANGKPIFNFLQYRASEADGLRQLSIEISDFTMKCPDTGIVVMGYSQGAHIVGDALCGVTGGLFLPVPPLSYDVTSSIRAIIQLGDPTNTRGLPWHTGNSTQGGIFPRQSFEACSQFGDYWQSYCDDDDFFCDRGQSIPVHLGYVERYGDEIVDFIVKVVEESQSRVVKCHERQDRSA